MDCLPGDLYRTGGPQGQLQRHGTQVCLPEKVPIEVRSGY